MNQGNSVIDQRGSIMKKLNTVSAGAAGRGIAVPLLGIAAAFSLSGCVGDLSSTSASRTSSPMAWGTTEAVASVAAVPPRPEDIHIEVLTLENKCFGSAGCLTTYTIDPTYIASGPLPDSTRVVYEILGADEVQTGNFTITGDGNATVDRETMISTPTGAQLTARVVQVIPGY